MMLDKAVLKRFPRKATAEDYAQAAGELERLLAKLPGAVAVYKFGSVTALGISDLDRLVVVEGRREVPDLWSQLSPSTRYLAMHTPVAVDPQTFTQHRWLGDLSDLEPVWGEPLPVERRPALEYSEPLLATEGLVVTALKLAKLGVTGHAKVRPLLCELRNVRLDLGLARLERNQAQQAWALADEVDRLRDEWWDLADAEQRSGMQQLLAIAPESIAEAITALGAQLVEPQPPPRTLRLRGAWRNVTVVPGDPLDGKPAGLLNMVGRSRRLGEARWRWVPRQLALPPGVISLLVGPAPSQYQPFRAARDAVVRRHADFLGFYGPGYSGLSFAPVFLQ
jgi:hypothetical protein